MAYHWSVHQLTEYFDAVTAPDTEDFAVTAAVERAVEALGAEVGALVRGDAVVSCLGLGRRPAPAEALASAIAGATIIDVPPVGFLYTAAAHLGIDATCHLVIGRAHDEFTGEERQLLLGMASVLGLALRSLSTLQVERTLRTDREREAEERLRLLGTLGQRQKLLESLLTIQRAISRRAPLQAVLDAVTSGAARLLDDAFVALVLADPLDPEHRMAPWAKSAESRDHDELVMAAAADAVAIDGVVTRTTGPEYGFAKTVVAAPVHIEGNTIGSLVTLDLVDAGDADERRDMLVAFAEQASLALTDARTVEAMRDAYRDSLTGLPNRALFLDRLNHALDAAARTSAHVWVLFMDLDRFKDVNDSLGHAAGDELLATVAGRIRACLRAEDTAARLGGDEFAILLERTAGDEGGVLVADRITRALVEPILVAGKAIVASASIGIASSEASSHSADDLLRHADLAMYTAKRNGAHRAVVYESSMHEHLLHGLEIDADLSLAIARDELHVQYQALVDLSTGSPVGVEALLRWRHPKRGLIPPAVFIPAAERSGLITEIGEWVLRESCANVARWRAGALPELGLSVNVSPRQLEDPAFADLVEAVLQKTQLPAAALTLEVTETALMLHAEEAIERLGVLRALGVRLAIDDFGTGYSSLASLSHFPIHQLKIDKSFIDAIGTSSQSAAIVGMIVELGRTLGLETVAEGIEQSEQHSTLREMQCNLGQGNLFARPLDSDAIPGLFRASTTPTSLCAS